MPVGALGTLPIVMEELGFDPWPLLESFGVTRELLASPMNPLSTVKHGQILVAAAEQTGCQHLGLLLGQRATLDNAGPLRFLILNAATVREAIENLIRFCGLWYRGLNVVMTEEEGYAGISLTMTGKVPGAHLLLTAYLAAYVKILELILGRSWHPTLVRIAYRKPKSSSVYDQYFQAPVWFGQAQHEVLFPQSLLDLPRARHDHQLGRFLHQHLSELRAREQEDFPAQVRQVIENLLATDCTAERVAEHFAIHRFTLYRHLSEQGTSFELLLEQVRRDLASAMLGQTDLPISEVATRLGYENQGNFARAFKRWHGRTPRDWRKMLAVSPGRSQKDTR